MHRRISSIALILFIVTVLNLFPVQVLAAEGYDPGGSIAITGDTVGSTVSNSSVRSGTWTRAKSGFRITILGFDGKPAFTFMGKDSLDLLFSRKDLENTWYFADGDKISGYRGLRTDYKKVRAESENWKDSGYHSRITTVDELYDLLIDGSLTTTIPNPEGDNLKDAINILATNSDTGVPLNLAYPLYSETKNGVDGWHRGDQAVRENFFGSGSKVANISLLNVLLNLRNGKTSEALWQPKKGYWSKAWISDADMAALKSGDLAPMKLMYNLEVFVSVEPIVWNRLMIGEGKFMGVPGNSDKVYGGVYGAQSTLGATIESLRLSKWTNLKTNGNAIYGGRDVSLFGRVGRKCMTTSKVDVHGRAKGKSFEVWVPDLKDVTNKDRKITNLEVSHVEPDGSNRQMTGWALHLYLLYSEEQPGRTHTFDPPNTPGKAPDPLKGLKPDDLKKVEPLAHYNIVKVYQTRDSVTNVVTYDGTFTKDLTVPKILIEDEPEYKVKEWKYGLPDPANPVIDGPTGTKWGDAPIKAIAPIESGTKPIPATVDIANKDDKDEVRTLYVLLEQPTKKPLPPPPPPPPAPSTPASNIITESQLVKAISTDRTLVGNNWGSYNFSATLEAAVTSHKYTACCGICKYDQADSGTCDHMRRANNDNYVSATTADQFNGRQVEPVETKGY